MDLPRPAAASWAGLALALLGLWHALLAPLPLLARLEQATEDWRQQLRSRPVSPHPDIAIIDLDEASLQALGHWPWPRRLCRNCGGKRCMFTLGMINSYELSDWRWVIPHSDAGVMAKPYT